MKNAIWRSRAVAILGFFILLLAVLPGLPVSLKNIIFVILSLAVIVLGFIGGKAGSYDNQNLS
jgi:hypothetical protein